MVSPGYPKMIMRALEHCGHSYRAEVGKEDVIYWQEGFDKFLDIPQTKPQTHKNIVRRSSILRHRGIAANKIKENKIKANKIKANKIKANKINANKIKANKTRRKIHK